MLRDVKGSSNSLSPHKQGHCDKVVPQTLETRKPIAGKTNVLDKASTDLNGLNPGHPRAQI